MHDNTALGYLQRSLQYLFRPGNLLYCGALAAVFIALRLLGDEGLAGVGMFIWFAAFALIAVFACKMLDSIQRLILGLEAEPVPLDVLSKLPKGVAIEAVIAVIFYGVIIYLIQLPLEGESRAFAFKTAAVLLYALTPAIVLGLLQGEGLRAVFNPAAWKRAIHDIGMGRYLIALLVPFLFALLILVIYILFVRLILPAKALNLYNSTSGAYGAPVIVYIVIILRGLIFAALLAYIKAAGHRFAVAGAVGIRAAEHFGDFVRQCQAAFIGDLEIADGIDHRFGREQGKAVRILFGQEYVFDFNNVFAALRFAGQIEAHRDRAAVMQQFELAQNRQPKPCRNVVNHRAVFNGFYAELFRFHSSLPVVFRSFPTAAKSVPSTLFAFHAHGQP